MATIFAPNKTLCLLRLLILTKLKRNLLRALGKVPRRSIFVPTSTQYRRCSPTPPENEEHSPTPAAADSLAGVNVSSKHSTKFPSVDTPENEEEPTPSAGCSIAEVDNNADLNDRDSDQEPDANEDLEDEDSGSDSDADANSASDDEEFLEIYDTYHSD